MSLSFFGDDARSWDLRVAKAFVYPDKLADVQERLTRLRASEPSSSAIPYCSTSGGLAAAAAQLTPRFLRVRADEACAEALVGPRTAWTALPAAGMTEAAARTVLRSALHAVFALHSRHIVHGYLSRLTVLLDRATAQRALLVAHVLPVQLFVLGSPLGQAVRGWAAPEIRRNEPYGPAADVWGLAIVLLQLTTPNSSNNSNNNSSRTGHASASHKELETDDLVDADLFAPFLHTFSPCAQSLLVQCLRADPARRPTLAELLMHPFFLAGSDEAAAKGPDGEEAASQAAGSVASASERASDTASDLCDDASCNSSGEEDEEGERSASSSGSDNDDEDTTAVVLTRDQ